MDMVVMVDMVMEDPMEVMVVTEAMVVMVMEIEKLKLSQDMVMEVMAMEDLMEVMVDIEAMVVMDMEREKLKLMLSQDMDMVVMVMESNQVFLLNATPIIKLLLTEQN